MMYAWYVNVWKQRRWILTKEYRYYYCGLWCFLTNQHLCRTPNRRDNAD